MGVALTDMACTGGGGALIDAWVIVSSLVGKYDGGSDTAPAFENIVCWSVDIIPSGRSRMDTFRMKTPRI